MEILNGVFSSFKEILYDVIGYVIPGIFIIFILCLPLIIKQPYSFMYSLYDILFNPEIEIYTNFISLFKNLSNVKIAFIIFFSYLLGHISIYLSSKLKPISKYFLSESDRTSEYKELCYNIFQLLKESGKLEKKLFMNNSGEYNEKSIITFASTYSRFNSHNDLIQKYICKINFYASFSFIFFALLIDSYFSYIFWIKLNNPSAKNIMSMTFIIIFLFISFLTFLNQLFKHTHLKEKECYLFLYTYLNK